MKNAIVFIADGSEEIETLTPVDYLRRAGLNVTLVSVGTESRTVTCSRKVSINADITMESYMACASDNELPDVVVIPGGMPGATNISNCRSVLSLIDAMDKENRLICSLCASPAVVLSKTSALKGKKWTCYPGMESNAGDEAKNYVEGVPFVHDKNLITGRGPGASEEFSMEIVKTMEGEEVWKKVKVSSMQS